MVFLYLLLRYKFGYLVFFAKINFREFALAKTFGGINFREIAQNS